MNPPPGSPRPSVAGTRRRAVAPVAYRAVVGCAIAVLCLPGCQGSPDTGDNGSVESEDDTVEVEEPAVLPEEAVVAEFEGDGDDVTEAFDVEEGWEIRWESQAESFTIELYTADDVSQGVVVEHEGEGGGSTFPAAGGRHYLDITAEGSWSIRVIEGAE